MPAPRARRAEPPLIAIAIIAFGCASALSGNQAQPVATAAEVSSVGPAPGGPPHLPSLAAGVEATPSGASSGYPASNALGSAASASGAPAPNPFPDGMADLDPTNDYIVAPPPPLADCDDRLGRAGVTFTHATLGLRQKKGAGYTCGAEQVVVYRGGPRHIHYNSPPLVTCGVAVALSQFEAVADEEAVRAFGEHVVRINHAGTYNCRTMARWKNFVSEHSYANAIDVSSFTLEKVSTISVVHDFGPIDAEPDALGSVFLRHVARRSFDEQVFSCVLTRFFDELHRDHMHLDLARYRTDGTRR